MTNAACALCTSAHVVYFGPRQGACWCVMKNKCVNPSSEAGCFSLSDEVGEFTPWGGVEDPHPLEH